MTIVPVEVHDRTGILAVGVQSMSDDGEFIIFTLKQRFARLVIFTLEERVFVEAERIRLTGSFGGLHRRL
jgi:hypothetical protein